MEKKGHWSYIDLDGQETDAPVITAENAQTLRRLMTGGPENDIWDE